MIKSIIIDDEPLARSILREYINDWPEVDVVAACNDGFEGIKAIQQFEPQLIFLDIQMPKINGFEMLELLDHIPAVIFTTAFDEFAIKAFEKNALDYLLKPFSKERFNQAMEKFSKGNPSNESGVKAVVDEATTREERHNRIVIKDGSKIRIIPVTGIHYLEAADDYVKIISNEGSFLKKRTMSFYENALESFNFVRVHRSYIVNVKLITRIDPMEQGNHQIRLSTGEDIPVSKTGYSRLKKVMGF